MLLPTCKILWWTTRGCSPGIHVSQLKGSLLKEIWCGMKTTSVLRVKLKVNQAHTFSRNTDSWNWPDWPLSILIETWFLRWETGCIGVRFISMDVCWDVGQTPSWMLGIDSTVNQSHPCPLEANVGDNDNTTDRARMTSATPSPHTRSRHKFVIVFPKLQILGGEKKTEMFY